MAGGQVGQAGKVGMKRRLRGIRQGEGRLHSQLRRVKGVCGWANRVWILSYSILRTRAPPTTTTLEHA
jgi:hypothetical protein